MTLTVRFPSLTFLLPFRSLSRGKYLAERASLCLGHFGGTQGHNSWFLERKTQKTQNANNF